jgi:hypothetical protein
LSSINWGSGASQLQVKRAVEAYFKRNPPQGGTATDEQVAAAVADYARRFPPTPGQPGPAPTDAQVLDAVATYLAVNPPEPEDAQVAQAVAAFLQANPPQRGLPGQDATAAQVTAAVTAYLQANPPAAGKDATSAQIATAVAAYLQTHPPAPGAPGAAGEVLVRQVNVTDTAVLAITLGTVDMQFPCAGAVVGERYKAHIRSHRLNNGATVQGRPALYWVVSADCRGVDTINVVHSRPALALGGKYELFTDIVKVNAT